MSEKMKIAIPVTANFQINDHFGHSEFFNVYTISEGGEIEEIKSIPSFQGCGCKSNIAGILAAEGVRLMLAGGIGAGAINVLNASGINVVRGCSGYADENVLGYIKGNVKDNGNTCDHHSHDGESSCRN